MKRGIRTSYLWTTRYVTSLFLLSILNVMILYYKDTPRVFNVDSLYDIDGMIHQESKCSCIMPIDKHIKWAIWVNDMINIQTHREWYPTCFYSPPNNTSHTVSSRQQNSQVDMFWRSTPGILVRLRLDSIIFLLHIIESPLSWHMTPGRIRRRVWYDTTIRLPNLEGTKTNGGGTLTAPQVLWLVLNYSVEASFFAWSFWKVQVPQCTRPGRAIWWSNNFRMEVTQVTRWK